MKLIDKVAYCGIYCPDCIHYQNEYSKLASELKNHLLEIGLDKYAKTKSPFGAQFQNYEEFETILSALAETKCDKPCRAGGGCSGIPCEIMDCCISKSYEGCWECSNVDSCDKFTFLEPRCGKMPKNNIRKIKKLGLDDGIEQRDNFYIWLK
ncbi:DUF3795 domain-containing protein [Maridesulfovibrio frigidus]|uniref:DUF3795 domain-containing protein n=1 Tax=Maridesulfovibrio frigidus TaxID=340956 RepID=UPI000B235805|nr:DUF3795 domain-containing protein [Maridesulfovibrio frigidus]